jgi:hypothetical protein
MPGVLDSERLAGTTPAAIYAAFGVAARAPSVALANRLVKLDSTLHFIPRCW